MPEDTTKRTFQMLLNSDGTITAGSNLAIQAVGSGSKDDVSKSAVLVISRADGRMGGNSLEHGRRKSGARFGAERDQTIMLEGMYIVACKAFSEDACESLAYHVSVLMMAAAAPLRSAGITVNPPSIGSMTVQEAQDSRVAHVTIPVTFSITAALQLSQLPDVQTWVLSALNVEVEGGGANG